MDGCLLTFDNLDTLEILLLLLWRHLQYYTEARTAGSQIQASTPHITRLVTSMDAESFKAEVPRKLSALLQRLDVLKAVIAFTCREVPTLM
jgi:nuclear pore complex protein Nup205